MPENRRQAPDRETDSPARMPRVESQIDPAHSGDRPSAIKRPGAPKSGTDKIGGLLRELDETPRHLD